MKRVIASLIAGVIIGSTGAAAATGYWSGKGTGYTCEGVSSGVICKSGNYEVGATKSYVFVQTRSGGHTFACRRWGSWSVCAKE